MNVKVSWKAWVTRSQMIQFVLFLVQSIYVTVVDCHKGTAQGTIGRALIFYALSLLVLFGNFYVQTYRNRKPAAPKLESSKKRN